MDRGKIEFVDITLSFGNLYTLKEFQELCEKSLFIDYDGSGDYATDKQVSNIPTIPSEFLKGNHPKFATHVMWYNK
jgi:hypothetical protein